MHANARCGDTNMFLCLNDDIKRGHHRFEQHPLSHVLSLSLLTLLLVVFDTQASS